MIGMYDHNSKYNDILNRLKKDFSFQEAVFLIIKKYFTNNVFYYSLCAFFRFIPLLLISTDYSHIFEKYNNSKLFQKILRKFTLYNIIDYFHISFRKYVIINSIIYFSFLVRLITYLYLVWKINIHKYTNIWPFPGKYRIISDHIHCLIFPYIIEYLSFSYYIFFLPDKFIIKLNDGDKYLLIIIMIINLILIINYNIINNIFSFCCNKIFDSTIYDAYKRPGAKIAYRCSDLVFFIFMFLQNLSLILEIERYINNYKYKIIYKIIITFILLLIISIIFISRMNQYKYTYFFNIFVNIIVLFSFYSIILDFIISICKYNIQSELFEIIYILLKIFISYLTYSLYILRTQKYLGGKIINILFREKNFQKKKYFLDSFYFLNELMINIKEKKNIISSHLFIDFINNHMINCNKQVCNCKLIENLLINFNIEKLQNYIPEILNIFNYLYESIFITSDYYNKLEIAILLSEHFCYLKDNPVMAFSIINNIFQKNKTKLTKYQKISIYELSQKYIYYISAKDKQEINKNKNDSLMTKQKEYYFKSFYNNLIISYKIKKLAFNYIDNLLKLLKYKNIFDDSLTFHLDEFNENIISVELDFLSKVSSIENNININEKNKINKKTNLNNIICLLRKENLYHVNLTNSIGKFELIKDMPLFIIFKYYIFYDILDGGKIPEKTASKLHYFLSDKIHLYKSNITLDEYSILKNLYYKQNNKKDSKYFAIFEFKKDLSSKYFSEECALKLCFKQKDIINKTIGNLMPQEFAKSHKNMLKQRIISEQSRYFFYKKGFLFDSSRTILYSINFESLLIYNISKTLIIISEINFKNKNAFNFMLNQNFDLIANSKNFEEEYYLNQKLFKLYHINLLDILKVKQEKINKKFEKTFETINNQNLIRQIKIEEYFIPQLYKTSSENLQNAINFNNFNNSKNKIFSKILTTNNNDSDLNDEVNSIFNDEKEKLINKEKIIKFIDDLIKNKLQIILHDKYKFKLRKKIFIENIAKELSKIEDNDILFQNEQNSFNSLIIKGKQLFNHLLTINEISNNFVSVKIKLSYLYNKVFYFVTILDEKKIYLKMLKEINIEKNIEKQNAFSSSISCSSLINNSPQRSSLKNNKNHKKNSQIDTNKGIKITFESSIIEQTLENPDIIKNRKLNIHNFNRIEEIEVLKKIDKYRKQINNDRFILNIRIILSFTIICILIIYILLINLKTILMNVSEKLLIANYYNYRTKETILNIHSKLLQIYYHLMFNSVDEINSREKQQDILKDLSYTLKNNFHYLKKYYFSYNLDIEHSFNLIYKNRKFCKIIGFWEEIEYESSFMTELDIIIYNLYSINILENKGEINYDFKNFLFFNNKTKYNEKPSSPFINLLFNLCTNYDLVYHKIFKELQEDVKMSLSKEIKYKIKEYLFLEIFALIFYIIFFIFVLVYLYYANQVIIKNLIFVFVDFTEQEYHEINTNFNNLIIFKLLELRKIIDDFNLDNFQKYKMNIDKINKNKKISFKRRSIDNENSSRIENNNKNNENSIENEITSKTTPNNSLFNNKNKINSSKSINNNLQSKKKIVAFKNEMNNKISMESNNFPVKMGLSGKSVQSRNKETNNSSQNYLMRTNSKLFKDKINFSPKEENNEILTNNINNINIRNKKRKNSNLKENEDEKINYQDTLLNKSYKGSALLIEIFKVSILLLLLVILIIFYFKIGQFLLLKNGIYNFFFDFSTVSSRFSLLHYFFNAFRTLMIFHEENTKIRMERILDNIDNIYEKENNDYLNSLADIMKNYYETKDLFKIISVTKKNSTEIIKEKICENESLCINYLNSNHNKFDSGIDFGYKSCISQISNIYKDYQKLKNKTDIKEIKEKIIETSNGYFNYISLALSNIIYYVEGKIFYSFQMDQNNYICGLTEKLTLLNVSSILFSLLTILYINVFIFITISKYSKPIKDSTYRINCSFYYIKRYSLTNMRKIDSLFL